MKASILGTTGYCGIEIAKILLERPDIKLTGVFSRNQEWSLADNLNTPLAKNIPTFPSHALEDFGRQLDIAFLATPPEVSLSAAEKFLRIGVPVIDLSGAFRLDSDQFKHWYGFEHTQKHLISKAKYGLQPWNNVCNTHLVANPGCFATSALMSILPLIQNGILEDSNIFIDGKSGVTGAGNSSKNAPLFAELSENFYPYKVGCHQHTPEIERAARAITNTKINVSMITSLLPIRRGIQMNIVAKSSASESKINEAFKTYYSDYDLLEFFPLDSLTDAQRKKYLSIKGIVGSPKTHIVFRKERGFIYIFTVIDNLLKGAASQAIENMDAMFGIESFRKQ